MGLLTNREMGLLNNDSIEEARKGKIVYLDLDEIHMNPSNIGRITEEEVNAKYDNILEVGLLQPLLVKRTDDGALLNTGHKRYLAIKKLTEENQPYRYMGKELIGTAPCQYLYDEMDSDLFNLVAIASNAHHPDSKEEKRAKVWQLHQYYQHLVQQNRKPAGREREWITAMTGISDGTVKTLLAGFNTQEGLQNGSVATSDVHAETTKDTKMEVTKKLTRFNNYLHEVDLTDMTDLDRQSLNDLLRNIQDTLEALIYDHR